MVGVLMRFLTELTSVPKHVFLAGHTSLLPNGLVGAGFNVGEAALLAGSGGRGFVIHTGGAGGGINGRARRGAGTRVRGPPHPTGGVKGGNDRGGGLVPRAATATILDQRVEPLRNTDKSLSASLRGLTAGLGEPARPTVPP